MTTSAYFSIGTNLGDRFANLQRALSLLQEEMAITAVSPIYVTEPWGDTDQPQFFNISVAAVTDLSPHAILETIKSAEKTMGRVPTRHWGPRLIDIDLVLYGHEVVDEPDLKVPHPHMAERAFVLAPLADIIPTYIHPVTGQTIQAMLDQVDLHSVERLGEIPFPLMMEPGSALA
jgi:2-amino-4-hydroxy-6-hydroxymethyldihydropteridine diphosphokinase